MELSEIKIHYTRKEVENLPRITDAGKAYELMSRIEDFQFNIDYAEMAYAIYLDYACNVIGVHKLSEGIVGTCAMDIRKVFQGAILSNAKGFVLVHNHPSGNLKFSKEDQNVYRTFKAAGELMGINLLDFIVMSKRAYESIN